MSLINTCYRNPFSTMDSYITTFKSYFYMRKQQYAKAENNESHPKFRENKINKVVR